MFNFSKKAEVEKLKKENDSLREDIKSLVSTIEDMQKSIEILFNSSQTMASDLGCVYEALKQISGSSESPLGSVFDFWFTGNDDDLLN